MSAPAAHGNVPTAGGVGGADARKVAEATTKAIEAADKAVDTVLAVMAAPTRGSQSQLAAARTVLEIAGVLGDRAELNRDKRAFLAKLRAGLTDDQWEAVRRALDGSPHALVDATALPADGDEG